MGVEFQGHVPDQVLDEDRVFVGPFRNGLLVLPFQQRVKFRAGGAFNDPDQILDPYGFPRPNLHGHNTALVVRAILGDRLGTGAQRGDARLDCQHEIDFLLRGRRVEAGEVIHHTF